MKLLMTFSQDPLTISQRLFSEMQRASTKITHALIEHGVINGKGNYLDITQSGAVSWRPLDRVTADQDPYIIKGRMAGKPAKALRSFLPKEFAKEITAQEWERFSNKFLAAIENANAFKLVDGEDIVTYYNEDSYSKSNMVRRLYGSCMRYNQCAPWVKMYADNPEQCRMLVEYDETGGLLARALVWTTDDGSILMDRIYGNDVSGEKFRTYAKEQGWFYKQSDNYSTPREVVSPQGDHITRDFSVTLAHAPSVHERAFPYCDTFHYFVSDDGKLVNSMQAVGSRQKSVYSVMNVGGEASAVRNEYREPAAQRGERVNRDMNMLVDNPFGLVNDPFEPLPADEPEFAFVGYDDDDEENDY